MFPKLWVSGLGFRIYRIYRIYRVYRVIGFVGFIGVLGFGVYMGPLWLQIILRHLMFRGTEVGSLFWELPL